jgi:uncharacterized repeat protein (TIGR01451 family)
MIRRIVYDFQSGPAVCRPWLRLTFSISLALALFLALVLLMAGANPQANAAMANLRPGSPIITLAKSVGPAQVASGQSLFYTLTVTNISPVSSTVSLFVTDTVPANTTFISANFVSGSGGVEMPSIGGTGVITWTPNVQLAPSSTLRVRLEVQVALGLRDGTIVVNDEYGASEAQADGVTGQPVTATVVAPALAIAKQADRSQVCDASQINYTLRVTNTGHLASSGLLTITDRLPAGTIFGGASPSATFDAASGWLTWTLAGPLAQAQAVGVNFWVTNPLTTPFGTSLVNAAYSATASDVPDVAAGALVTVTAINVRAGFTATAHAFTDLPVTLFNTSTGSVSYYLWDFGDGSLFDTRLNPTHTYTREGNFTVTLTANGPCGVSVAQRPITVTSIIVALVKSVTPERVTPGGTLLYVLTLSNTSATHNTASLVVADAVPIHTGFESAGFIAPAFGNISVPSVGGQGIITWTPGAQLAPGDSLQLALRVKAAPTLPAETIITNNAYAVFEARSEIITGNPVTAMVVMPSSIALNVVPTSLPVTGTAMFTATVYDKSGFPVTGEWVSFTTPDSLGVGAIVPSFAATGPGGRVTGVISSTQPGVKRVVAATGSLSATTFVMFTVGPGEPYTVALRIDPASPWITETARLTATVMRQDGQPLQGITVTFSSPDAFGIDHGSAIMPLSGNTDANGQVTVTLTSLVFGDKRIIATVPNGVASMLTVNWRTIHYLFLPIARLDYAPPLESYTMDR